MKRINLSGVLALGAIALGAGALSACGTLSTIVNDATPQCVAAVEAAKTACADDITSSACLAAAAAAKLACTPPAANTPAP